MRVHLLRLCVLGLAAAALACGGSGSSKAKKGGKPDASTAPPKEEAVKLDTFWDDPSYTVIGDQAPCPEGWWALFGGDPPGATKEEQKANLARKPELKKALEAKTFLVHMQSGDEVSVGEYSNAKGEQDINVKAWQENQMITFEVTDLDAYWAELNAKNLAGTFAGVKLRPPEQFPWGRELHIIDPGGVCWHIRQSRE